MTRHQTQRRTLRALLVLPLLVVVAAVAVTAMRGRDTFVTSPATNDLADLTVVSGSDGDVVLGDDSTYSQIVDSLNDEFGDDDDITVALPQISGLPAGLVANNTFAVANSDVGDDGVASVAFVGTEFGFTDIDGAPLPGVQLAVVATWADPDTPGPEVAVLLNLSNQSAPAEDRVDLTSLIGLTNPIPLGSTILAVGSDGYTITPFDDESGDADSGVFSAFLDDGNDANEDTFTLAGGTSSINLLLAGGVLDTAAAELGGAVGVRLSGSITDSTNGLALLSGTVTPTIDAFSVAGAVEAVTPDYFPNWVSIDGTWAFAASYDGVNASGLISGGIAISPDGENEASAVFTAEFSVGEDPSFGFEAEFSDVTDLLGQDWLAIPTATLAGTVDNDVFGASLAAEFSVGAPPAIEGELAFEVVVEANDDIFISAEASISNDISAVEVINAIDPSLSISDDILDVTITDVSFVIDYARVGGETELFAALFGATSLTIGGATPQVDMLFRVAFAGGETSLFGAARASGLDLGDIDTIVGEGFDWTLPDLTVIVSTAASEEPEPFADLDGPTQDFFGPILCEDPDDVDTCADLEIVQGVELLAAIELPDFMIEAFEEIGIAGTDAPTLISGTIPLFGSTEDFGLAIEFPEVEAGENALVASGQFSIFLNVSTDGLSIEAGISGDMVFRVTRPDQGECSSTSAIPDGTFPATGECYDTLDLNVTASIGFDAGSGSASITLSGTVSSWDNAFGLDWLDIEQISLTLGFNIEAGGGVTIDVIFAAGLTIDETDLTFAASATFTPSAPWLIIKGITAGTQNGVSLPQLADYFGLPDDGLPDLSIRNAWFGWGVEEDLDNCILQGLFISAELHLGAVPDGDVTPGCGPGTAFQDLIDGIGDSCEDSDTCIAAIQLEVLPSQPRFFAQATIAGFTLGPVDFEPTEIQLLISPSVQRLTFRAGATLRDPVTGSGGEWASGRVELELGQDGGLVTITIEAEVTLADDFFGAYVHGSGSADFNTFSGGDIVAFLDSIDAEFTVELTAPGLEKLGEDILMGLEDTGEYLEDVGMEIEDFFVEDVGGGISSAVDDIGDFFGGGGGSSTEADLQALRQLFQLQPDEFGEVIDGIEDFIAGIPLVSREDARNAVRPLRRAYKVRESVLDGSEFSLDFGIYTWTKSVAGGCATGNSIDGDPICDADEASATEVIDRTIEPVIDQQLADDTGLTAPASAGDAADVALVLATTLTGPQLEITCLAFDYENPDEAEFGGDFFGLDIGRGDVDYSEGFTVSPTSDELNQTALDLNQDRLDSAVEGGSQTTCSAPIEPAFAAGSTFFISTTEIDEGQSVTVNGSIISGLGVTQLFIDWGDGSDVLVVPVGEVIDVGIVTSFSESHTYLDDVGDGPANNVVVSLSADAVPFSRHHTVTVNNVDPVLSNLSVSETEIDEGDTITLTGDLSDVGILDTHEVEIVWGDGTRETLTLAQGATSFSVDHTYLDDADPPTEDRTDSTDFEIRVTLIDDDTGDDTGTATVTVDNVTPADPEPVSVTIDGDDAPTTGGVPLVPDGEEAIWTWTVVDPGPDDNVVFAIDWGDGTFSTSAIDPTGQAGIVTVTPDPNDPTIKIVTAAHTYTGHNDGTPFTILIEVSDKDTPIESQFEQPVVIGNDFGTDFRCFVAGEAGQFTVTVVNPPAPSGVDFSVVVGGTPVASFSLPETSIAFTVATPGVDLEVRVDTQIVEVGEGPSTTCGQVDVDDPDAALGIDKVFTGSVDNDDDGVISAGDDLEYTITATNTGSVDLTNVVVDDDLTFATTTCAGPVAPGGTCVLTTTWVVLESDEGTDVDNTATADSDQTPPVSDVESVPVPADPELAIDKSFVDFTDNDGSTDITVGDELDYLIVATNSGTGDLTNVVVVDDLTGATTTCPGPVAPLDTCELTTSYTVVAADVGTTVTNTATADSDETGPVDDTVEVPVATPDLAVDKTFIGFLDNDGTSDISEGDDLVYRLTATNSGETGLTGLTMSDDLTGTTIDCAAIRDPHLPGQSCTDTVRYTVTGADLGTTITNTVTADSVQAGPVDDTAAVPVASPALAIDKEFTGYDDIDGSGTITVGDELQYSIVATNSGSSNLTNLVVSDDLTGASTTCAGPVTPGRTCELDAFHTVTADDVGGDVVNTATADSDQVGPVDDTVIVPVVGSPGLAIDKTFVDYDDVDGSRSITAGDLLNYSIVATNTGDVDLTNLTVTDDLTGASTTCPGPVAPGDTCTLTTQYEATTADAGGVVTNTATADSDQVGPVTDSVDVPVVETSIDEVDLSITKADDVDPVEPGGTLVYTIEVTNAGPSDAANVVVSDTLPAEVTLVSTSGCINDPDGVPICELGDLAAGASASYTVTVTVDDTAATALLNIVTVTSSTPETDTTNNMATEPTLLVGTDPGGELTIVKTTSVDRAQVGDTVTYGYEVGFVPNVAGSTAAGVTVTDDRCDPVDPVTSGGFNVGDVDLDGRLAEGETWRFSCDYTVDAADALIVPSVELSPIDDAGTGADYIFTFEHTDGTLTTISGDTFDEDRPVNKRNVFRSDVGGDSKDDPSGIRLRLSCSDSYPNGFSEDDSTSPTAVDDPEWRVAAYSIIRYEAGRPIVTCTETIRDGAIVNTATVTATDAGGNSLGPVQTQASIIALDGTVTAGPDGDGQLDIEKTADTGRALLGTEVSYTYRVGLTEGADGPATGVTVTDNLCDPLVLDASSDLGADGVLAEGETWVYTCTVTLAESDRIGGVPYDQFDTGTTDGARYTFVFEHTDGSTTTIAGTTQGTAELGEAFLAGAGGPSATAPTGLSLDVTCSDIFRQGFAEENEGFSEDDDGRPNAVDDPEWRISYYSITVYGDGEITRRCSAINDPTDVLNLAVVQGTAGGHPLPAAVDSATVTSRPRILYLSASDPVPTSEEDLLEHLFEIGYETVVVDDDAVTASDADGVELVMISTSVTPTKIGSLFTATGVPLITWEYVLYDDLGFTGSGGNQAGQQSNLTAINVLNPASPIAAGLGGGNQTVLDSSDSLSWGRPQGDVDVVAAVPGSSGKAVVFAYDTGDAMATGTAPARRVGLFPTFTSLPDINDDGLAVLDAAVEWALGGSTVGAAPVITGQPTDQTVEEGFPATFTVAATGTPSPSFQWRRGGVDLAGETGSSLTIAAADLTDDGAVFDVVVANSNGSVTSDPATLTVTPAGIAPDVLLVASGSSLSNQDQEVADRLAGLGFEVTTIDDDDVELGDEAGYDLVVVSTSIGPSKVGSTFTAADVPVLTWEPFLFDDLGLSTGNGQSSSRTTLTVTDTASDITAGFSGTVTVTSQARAMSQGTPAAGVDSLATVGSKTVIMSAEAGSIAPARRVGFFFSFSSPRAANGNGWTMFDQAVTWVTG